MLSNFVGIFKYHKKKMLLALIFFILFLYFLFPFNDLSDLVSSKVSEATQGQVYVNFESLNFSVVPSLGVTLTDVAVETPFFPPLKAAGIAARPSILGLLTFKPGISLSLEKIFGGDIDLSTRGADKNKNGTRKQKLNLSFDSIKLMELFQSFDVNLRASGQLQGQIDSLVDIDFTEQPKSEIAVNVSKLNLEETDINIQGLPITIPKIALNQMTIEGKTENGQLQISKFTFGGPGQDLTGQVSGRMGLNLIKQGSQISFQPGGFDLNVKFQMSETLKQKLSSYVGLLQNYQIAQNTYSLKLVGTSFYGVPQITKGQ